MSKRRTRKEIVQLLYDALPVQSFATIDQLSKDADVDWGTVKTYMEDLEFELGMQGPRFSWLETITLGANKGYRRKRK